MNGFHTCGHPLWLTMVCGCVIRFDEDDTSPTCGLEVDTCPGCGNPLFPADIVCEDYLDAPSSDLQPAAHQ